MSDYTQNTTFATKDSLITGNPEKIILGADFDGEFSEIASVSTSKENLSSKGQASGYCGLTSSSLVAVGNLPIATETAIGALEIATQTESDTGTDDVTIVTPLKMEVTIQAHLDNGAGLLDFLKDLTDPGADRGLYWDDTDNALEFLIFGDGLTIDQANNTLDVDMLGLEDLVDPTADRIYFYDDTADIADWLIVSGGLEIDNGTKTIQILDKAADTTDAVAIISGIPTLDFSSLTAITVAGLAATDSLVLNDGGVLKQIDVQDMGIRVVNSSIAQTFDVTQNQTLQVLTGGTGRTWDIPTDAAQAFPIGAVIYLGARDTAAILVSPNTSAVRLTCVQGSDVGPSDGDQTITAGGIAALIKVDTNEWMLGGDIA